MRVGFLCKRAEYAHSTPVMEDVFSRLRRYGIDIECIIPEEHLIDLASVHPICDLYVIRPGVELALSLAGALHDEGAPTLNKFPSCVVVQDKVRVTRALLRAGIPTARSFVTGTLRGALAHTRAPIIVKPHRGSYGEGVRVVQDAEEHDDCVRGGCFVQEYLPNTGYDLKVYVIGEEVMAIRRPFPANTYEDKIGQPVVIDSYVEQLALQIGRLFDLQVYGIDIIETPRGLCVIDVNFFPGFVGVPNAAEKLAVYISSSLTCHSTPVFSQPLAVNG